MELPGSMPAPVVGSAQAIAEAISQGFKLLSLVISGADQRRLRNGVDIADRIFKRYHSVVPSGMQDPTINKWINDFYNRVV